MQELATYRSHKIVKAGEIVRIDAIYAQEGERPSSFRVHCKPGTEGAGVVIKDVPYGVFARLISERGSIESALGQILVIYAGGFISWSPKDEFDEGYERLGEEDAGGRYIGLER